MSMKVGRLDVTLLEFSSTKVASFKADIVSVPKNKPPPIDGLIIGIESCCESRLKTLPVALFLVLIHSIHSLNTGTYCLYSNSSWIFECGLL